MVNINGWTIVRVDMNIGNRGPRGLGDYPGIERAGDGFWVE